MFTRTAVTPADCLYYAENLVSNGGLSKPSPKNQASIDWEMAHKLDKAGDKYKAEGNLKSAQVCYSRAFARATRAHKATI